ncbi:hypothetical protein AAULR_07141 [Lacticaseibacillus rhamnosus MTCC 5462]|nr:hypothetical protein AAULR_07141 [Lacticaseibacillus rhamnosus MTCC 5462]
MLGFVANWGMIALVIAGLIVDKQMRWWYLGYPALMGINIGLNLILPLQLADQASYLAPFSLRLLADICCIERLSNVLMPLKSSSVYMILSGLKCKWRLKYPADGYKNKIG